MRTVLLVPLLALGLGACSSDSSSIGVGASAGTSVGGYYGSHYGAYPWWYDDYFNYWDHYYPWCCDNEGDFDELIKKWWNGLDADRQQEIKDKFHNWQDNQGQADLAALRGDFATRWNAMSPEQKQALRDNSKLRPSVSNPDRTPRSPLDYKGDAHPRADGTLRPTTLPKTGDGALLPTTLPKTGDGTLLPATLPKADNGALWPTTQPKAGDGTWTPSAQPRVNNGVVPRPHLPSTLASPMSRPAMPHRMAPPMRSFPAIRRR
ncbi:hypothetical protein ACW5XF_01050 [Aeromonas lusitana]|uniref:DUF3106 domain-containing protein n=1 Tax=Aeromonas lusitana TaxID=931529 RepID=A0A2M8HE26_9GAMM|nr:hypothetical protein [Aeromonas lusitana]PJC94818.1 hypothetical protein CUC44_02445 [Aeromonas lusitana]